MPTKLIILILLLAPTLVFAQSYEPLVGIPGVDGGGDFDTYINAIYALSISIAALLAVIKIIIAGVKWMTTDIVTSKSDAKKDIKGALLGLLVILAAVLIINIINPNIAEVDLSINQVTAPTGEGLYEGSEQAAIDAMIETCSSQSNCRVEECETAEACEALEETCANEGGRQGFAAGDNRVCIGYGGGVNVSGESDGAFSGSVEIARQEEGESGTVFRNRVFGEYAAAGEEVLFPFDGAVSDGSRDKLRAETRCEEQGGTSMVYLVDEGGSYRTGYCLGPSN